MKFSNRFLLLATLLPFCGCSSIKQNPNVDAQAKDHRRNEVMAARERQFREEYHRQYAAFEVSSKELPVFEKKTFTRLSRVILLTRANRTRLELVLGHRWAVATNSIFRTESRYRLCDGNGRLLAAGESTLALEDISSDGGQEIALLSDSSRHAYFIDEEQSWATRRHILIRPSDDAEGVYGGIPTAWTVSYLQIPERHKSVSPLDHPRILGLHSDRLYIEQDGHIYAFPIDTLKQDTNLSYSIG